MMGELGRYMMSRLAKEVEARGVVVWWDPSRAWDPWIEKLPRVRPAGDEVGSVVVQLGPLEAILVRFPGSYLEVADQCDRLMREDDRPRIVVYLPGETHQEELSPLRELECLGGQTSLFQPSLTRSARQALKASGLPDGEIDELLRGDSLSFEYLDRIRADEGGHASSLAPLFGSGREQDVVPGFLIRADLRAKAAEHQLLGQVVDLVHRGLGLSIAVSDDPDQLADRMARAILVAELRADLSGGEPAEISQVPKVHDQSRIGRCRAICKKLRLSDPAAYMKIANQVEDDLGLAKAEVDPTRLGQVDTFSFEERAIRTHCARLVEEEALGEARRLVEDRAGSFWTSLEHFPERRAEWQLLGNLIDLAEADTAIRDQLTAATDQVPGWIEQYAEQDGWHRADQLFRSAYSRLTRLDGSNELESAAQKVLTGHDDLVDAMTRSFIERLESADWAVDSAVRQRRVFEEHVRKASGPVALILADALRYEMGAELARLLEVAGAVGVRLGPAVAEVPTITPVGMAALLPGAERSFEVVACDKGVCGAIDNTPLATAHERMQHAKAEKPGLVELTLDALVYELSPKKLRDRVSEAPVVIVRSTEIDVAGEALPGGLARRIMGSVVEDIRKAVLRLAEAGISRFVVAADHGHLFGLRRDDSMKIDSPTGGEKVDLHRRCWVGRGGNTPPGCARVSLHELGYTSDLDLIVPRGNGVFRAGGDLAYHHGGLSLQELVIPVLTFGLETAGTDRRGGSDVSVASASDKITNRIFTVTVQRSELALEPIRLRLLALDNKGLTVGQAMYANAGWDPESNVLTLGQEDSISVAIQLDDDSVDELRVAAVEVETDRTVKQTKLMPVKLLS